MDYKAILELIKASFCNLNNFKLRSNSLEVVTAFSTLNNKFVSVFVTLTKGKIVVTDNGWISQNYYDTPFNDEIEHITERVKEAFKVTYNVKKTTDKSGAVFYYKTCTHFNEIPSAVFDLANFSVGCINSLCIPYEDEKEQRERETFKSDVDTFLKTNYSSQVRLRQALDDFSSIKFNAIITKGVDLFLLTYVTGSTHTYFENDLRKSIVNFEIAEKSKFRDNIQERLTVYNDSSDGYLVKRTSSLMDLLKEKTTREPIKWSEKEKVLELV